MITIPRRDSIQHPSFERADTRTPGPWWWQTRAATTTPRPVWCCCPRGHLGTLIDHAIADDGTVTPSIACMEAGCDWHVNARLGDWTP